MTTLLNKQLAQVIETLKQVDDRTVIQAYNDYADENSYEPIMTNDVDNIDICFNSPHEALQASHFGDYNANHNYYVLNGYANLVSFNYPEDDNCPIDLEELAQWLINEDKLNDYDINVVTLDDMLASIEDNIADDENLLNIAIDYLGLENDNDSSYDEKVFDVMYELNKGDYIDAQNTMKRLGINYE